MSGSWGPGCKFQGLDVIGCTSKGSLEPWASCLEKFHRIFTGRVMSTARATGMWRSWQSSGNSVPGFVAPADSVTCRSPSPSLFFQVWQRYRAVTPQSKRIYEFSCVSFPRTDRACTRGAGHLFRLSQGSAERRLSQMDFYFSEDSLGWHTTWS